ncbi:MAG: hypothetical protein ACLFV3_05715 [Phycisphaeraceae bacterium]
MAGKRPPEYANQTPNDPMPKGPWRPPRGPVFKTISWILLGLIALGGIVLIIISMTI